MRILILEHPRIKSEKHFNDIANTPLWSCLMGGYVAAGLEKTGQEVHYVDAASHEWDFERTTEEVFRRRPHLICINAVYFWEHTPGFFDWLASIRTGGYKAHINLFGFFPTLAYNAILASNPAVDSVSVGECEETLIALAEHLAKGLNWHDIPGLAFRTPTGIGLPGFRKPASDPDKFSFPRRHLKPGETVSILASRGCYNHCSFCPVPVFYNNGPLWRGRSPENIVQELTLLMDQGIRDFYFVDPNFIGPGRKGKERTMDLCRQLAPLSITFGMETRSSDLDAQILEALVSAGLQSLLLGVESGSAGILNNLNKGASQNISERAIGLCRSAGIEPEIGFLMFVPDSILADLEHNLAFLRRNLLLDRLDRTANLLCHYQIVFMGTSGYRCFQDQDRLTQLGPLGFEGDIAYGDPRVKWVSEVMIPVCHSVLRDMSQPGSPTDWRCGSANSGTDKRVNDFLVDTFERLLATAGQGSPLPRAEPLVENIEADLTGIYYGS
ncbi:MAG: B12-binding domain-containing radical SAM protein [Deltaproteobacteria bacterium]|nr:B12-binding domain-containing radical SAM protein [Deltaproteobacteria bacterium]